MYEQNVAAINLFALAAAGKGQQDGQDSPDVDADDYGALSAQRPVEEAIGG